VAIREPYNEGFEHNIERKPNASAAYSELFCRKSYSRDVKEIPRSIKYRSPLLSTMIPLTTDERGRQGNCMRYFILDFIVKQGEKNSLLPRD
jgi:hypothetical protein